MDLTVHDFRRDKNCRYHGWLCEKLFERRTILLITIVFRLFFMTLDVIKCYYIWHNEASQYKEEALEMGLFDRFKKEKPSAEDTQKFGAERNAIWLDMLNVCQDFANQDEDKTYVICGDNEADWFYLMNGKILAKNELNTAGRGQYDVSDAAIQACREKLLADWQKLVQVCVNYHQDVPKLTYVVDDARSRNTHANFIMEASDIPAAAADWIQKQKEKCAEAAGKPTYNWKGAYRAKVKYYSNDRDVMGVYALGEGVDTVLPVNHPRTAYDGKEITHWELALVPVAEDRKMIRTDYQKSIKILPTIAKTEIVEDVMLVKGMTLEEMEKLADLSGRLS
jgi:hypothetical protein